MVESRWVRWIGPGVLALVAAGFITSSALGAGGRPWLPRACSGPPADRIGAARGGDAVMAALPREAWFRVDPRLDGDGALDGQRLELGLGSDQVSRQMDLPAESFVTGPFGRVVLVGSDDRTVSRLQAVDVARGCAWDVGEEHDVIRRATVDATGSWIYETRVDRSSRADLGVWIRPMAGDGSARRVLAPLPADVRFGRTFSTEFTWDLAGTRLAVQSCGEIACRARVIGSTAGPDAIVDAPDLGPLIGFDGERVVTYLACRGLPCPIVATQVTTGARTALTAAAGRAVLVSTPAGARLVHETLEADGRRLRAVDLASGSQADLGPLPDGLDLHPSAVFADSNMRLPTGWVLLSPGGRMPTDRSTTRPVLRQIQDGTTVQFDEVTR